jgi:hypothetical protein
VKWEGERELLGLGVGIGVVIVALTFFLSLEAGQERVTPGC